MKITNVILSILILLLAIALAVSSFFLYEKREIMLNGWSTFAQNINTTAATLDKDSGTDYAKDLTTDTLAHTQYKNLDSNLQKLNESAKKHIEQRDNFAAAIVAIANITKISKNAQPDDLKLKAIESSKAETEKVIEHIRSFKNRRDKVISSIKDFARHISVSVETSDLEEANHERAFNDFKRKFNNLNAEIRSLKNKNADLNRKIKSLESQIGGLKNQITSHQNGLRSVAQTAGSSANYNSVRNKVTSFKNQIAAKDRTIKAKDADIAKLKRIIGLSGNRIPNVWKDGSKEARSAIEGKIVEINEKFGFYVVNFGSNIRAKQTIGNKVCAIDPQLKENMKITVVRDKNTPDVKFVANAKIVKVNPDSMIIEVIKGGNPVKIGDDVYFSEMDLR